MLEVLGILCTHHPLHVEYEKLNMQVRRSFFTKVVDKSDHSNTENLDRTCVIFNYQILHHVVKSITHVVIICLIKLQELPQLTTLKPCG